MKTLNGSSGKDVISCKATKNIVSNRVEWKNRTPKADLI